MIDTLMSNRKKAEDSGILESLKLKKNGYATLTLHRPSNVDNEGVFMDILEALYEVQKKIKIVWPIHPRTKNTMLRFRLNGALSRMSNLRIISAIGYLDFLKLMANSRFVLTDSGGIQEETTVLKVPCLTLRNNTERPVTIEEGTNIVIGQDAARIVDESMKIISGDFKKGRTPRLWDGSAAKRIVSVLLEQEGQGNGTR